MAPIETLRVVPLGGLGRIGGNMMVYESARDLVVVDCGVLFPSAAEPGVDYIIPNINYILERRDKLRAILITHGHEDHIGALPYVLPQLQVPVYAPRFARILINSKLGEFPHVKADLHEIRDDEPFRLGELEVHPVPVTHSIPDAVALVLDTPVGRVIHTGDFKLDPQPIDGRLTHDDAFARAGDAGVALLCSDSTNAGRPGHTWSEQEVRTELTPLITDAPHRVVVSTFSSNIHRLQVVLEASAQAGRKVILVGQSVQRNVQLALENGLLHVPRGLFADVDDFDRLPRDGITVVASGCQGEPRSALPRIAAGEHDIELELGDRVLLSARKIPGNEKPIGRMLNLLARHGIEVIDDRKARVHTSGHAFSEEQRQMLQWCRPRFFVPLHGEYRHLSSHTQIALEAGISPEHVFLLEDGQPLALELRGDGALRAHRAKHIEAGNVYVKGRSVGLVDDVVLRDRRLLAEVGIVACVATFTSEGALVAGPELITRGVLYVDLNAELLEEACNEVRQGLAAVPLSADNDQRAEQMRLAVRRFFRRELGWRPIVVPLVMEAG